MEGSSGLPFCPQNPVHLKTEAEMGFEIFCAALIALIFGLVVMMNGYKLFLVLLPIWGFIFGFVLGADTLQTLFGQAFLATVTSWVVGFVVGSPCFRTCSTSSPSPCSRSASDTASASASWD
jgi:hypothetical protein